jgi:hypothetical protein
MERSCKVSELIVTEWFSPFTKPVYKGIYERRMPDNTNAYSYFDGKSWHWNAYTIGVACAVYYADDASYSVSRYQNLPWRGVVESVYSENPKLFAEQARILYSHFQPSPK